MRFVHKLARRWEAVRNRGRKNDELSLEIQQHLEMEIAELVEEGMSYKEARQQALREFGNVESLQEQCREVWGIRLLDNLRRYLSLAIRQLAKDRGYATVAVLTLALGVGVNAAIYSLIHTVFVQPLPYDEPDQIVHLREISEERGLAGVSYPNYKDWMERQSSFSEMGAYQTLEYNLNEERSSLRIEGCSVSHGFFNVLSWSPLRGRFFSEEDDLQGAEATVVLGERFWRTHYAAKDSILGEQVSLTGRLYTVIGVLPEDAEFGGIDAWTPLGLISGRGLLSIRTARTNLRGLARLDAGVSIDQARSEFESIAANLAVEHPRANAGMSVRVKRLVDLLSERSSSTLVPLMGASAFLLLIACANVAIMQMIRSLGRRHEFATRVSLGANRGQIVGQLFVENMVLALFGGFVGIVVAIGSLELLKSFLEFRMPQIGDAKIDFATLAYATGASIASSLLFGIAPMRDALRLSPRSALTSAGRGSESGLGKRWTALVVGEFALTCALLVGAGLMIRTTSELSSSSPGFETADRLMFKWTMEGPDYNLTKRRQTLEQVRQGLQRISGVESVGIAYPAPFSGSGFGQTYQIEGRPTADGKRGRSSELIWVGDDYFETMGIRLLKGRWFNEFDASDSPKVAIVDSKFAEINFPGEDPIGKRYAHGNNRDTEDWIQIVGVVERVTYRGFQSESREQTYHSIQQEIYGIPFSWSFILKTRGDLAGVSEAVSVGMGEIDSRLPVRDFGSFESKIGETFAHERMMMQLLGIMAVLALLLASVGLYGVLSYGVKQRTQEFGIRIAIGAEPRALVWMIVKNGILLSGIGVAVGLVFAAALSRFLSSLLYGVSQFDLTIFVAVSGLLVAIAVVACWVPAVRASRLSPSLALRGE